MKKLINISNHALSQEQVKEFNALGYETSELNAELKTLWGNISPENLDKTIDLIVQEVQNFDAIKIDGFAPAIVRILNKTNKKAYYAYSKRVSVEKIGENGEVVKTAIFKHMGFFEY